MFGNFLYFIVALLIYATYQPADAASLSPVQAVLSLAGLFLIFFAVTNVSFRRLAARVSHDSFQRLDHQFRTLENRYSVAAVGMFALEIYGLSLPSFSSPLPLFQHVPTLEALLFIILFAAHLAAVWVSAHPARRALYGDDLRAAAYVASNLSFSVPVLLPWLLLSGIADLVTALPFEAPRRFMETPGGQTTYFILFLIVASIFGPLMIQKFWRCEPMPAGPWRDRIVGICRRAGMRFADVLYWSLFEGRMLTAGVMGLVHRFRYILVTPGLLRILVPEEVDAVIAHEIGHVKKHHMVFYLVFFAGYLLLSYATLNMVAYFVVMAEPFLRWLKPLGVSPATQTSICFSVLIICIFLVYFRFVFGYFMRNFERQADTYVYELLDSGIPLVTTLEKIAIASGQPADLPNWHHFSIRQRADFIRKCENDRSWIQRHNRKVRVSIVVYLLALLLTAAAAYHLNYGDAGRRLNASVIETVVLRELEKSPQNADLYNLLGDIYYEQKKYTETMAAYQHALSINPDNPTVLNNLAWLLVTCEQEEFRNPAKAVTLAEAAIRLSQEPHIWDTLAEAYFATGDFKRAIESGEKALSAAKSNRGYYEEQLEKFRRGG